ncbi:SDR family NAD(P)-dependent oxidoreductase [Methylocucumis oryzae]|uniref:Ketoreductase domain-containing protein n=1 Tax=Methylocucumis oryzae TaxID=1632867 RepID=A0A0F3IJ72_9GAMM|nr:SDR family NAD(P)-dependent oxidoreductase [Methylocucumis oryzae]KJV06717.1 hypothetical protein VZ94_09445 [Methylocucumis oryzae]
MAEVRLQQGRWLALDWREITLQPTVALPWQQQGVYLVTGGLGGVGFIVARELAVTIPGVRIVLVGRSEADLNKLSELRALASVDYFQANLADLAQVQALAVWLKQHYGQLNGVLHSAGVVRDKLILRKTEAEFADVFAPKVNAVLNLDNALQDFDLDFCVYFSSMTSVVGNPGQADYAAANGFIDAYAEHRQRQVQAGLKTRFNRVY